MKSRNQSIFCKFIAVAFVSVFLFASAGWAATYYVDKNNKNASDSNPGTATMPWETIQKGASVAKAGDTVYVKDGVYYEWVDIKNSGTSGKPITLMAYPGDHPIIDGSKTTIEQSYDGLINSRNHSYITVDGFEVRNSNAFLIRLSYGDYLTIKNCIVHDNTDASGSYNGQSGIFIDHCNAGLVEHNESYHTGGNALDAESTNNVTFQYNYAHDNPAHNGINIFPKTTEQQIDYHGNDVKYNIIARCSSGILMRHQTYSEISNNLIYGSANNVGYSNGAIFFDNQSGDPSPTVNAHISILNNTIVDNAGRGINNWNFNYLTIKNNIFFGNGNKDLDFSSAATTGHDIDYNLYSPSSQFRWGSSAYTSLASWISASKQDSHSSEADPNFKNRSANDYRLTSNSKSAIDKGLDLSSFGITKDLNGISRPQGKGFDIGAYEYITTGVSQIDPPSNLRLQ